MTDKQCFIIVEGNGGRSGDALQINGRSLRIEFPFQ
jgi:hypothetical protein